MQDATLKQVKAGAGCTLYSIQFVEKEETEYEEFMRKFKDDCVLNADLLRILAIVNKIAEMGALERYFRPEGCMRDGVCALPTVKSKLRLYCLRLSNTILILGNGGEKKTQRYQDDEDFQGYVLDLQAFDNLIKEGVAAGTIVVTEKEILTDQKTE